MSKNINIKKQLKINKYIVRGSKEIEKQQQQQQETRYKKKSRYSL